MERRGEVRIDPNGRTLTITVRRDGQEADAHNAGGDPVTWPLTISNITSLVLDYGEYELSALAAGMEVAGREGRRQPFAIGPGTPPTLEVEVDPAEMMRQLLGFTRPEITGVSTGVLAEVLTALDNIGIVVDNTTHA